MRHTLGTWTVVGEQWLYAIQYPMSVAGSTIARNALAHADAIGGTK